MARGKKRDHTTNAELGAKLATKLRRGLGDDFARALALKLGAARRAELVAVLTAQVHDSAALAIAYTSIAQSRSHELARVVGMLKAGLDSEYAAVLASELVMEPEPSTLSQALAACRLDPRINLAG